MIKELREKEEVNKKRGTMYLLQRTPLQRFYFHILNTSGLGKVSSMEFCNLTFKKTHS